MKGSRAWCAVAALCLVSCAEASSPERARAAPPVTSCKPEAPVVVEVNARGEVRATPTRAVPDLEVSLIVDGIEVATEQFGATGAGEARTLLGATDRGKEIAGVARVAVDGVVMSRTALLALEPPPPPRTRRYALDDGDRAEEVRP